MQCWVLPTTRAEAEHRVVKNALVVGRIALPSLLVPKTSYLFVGVHDAPDGFPGSCTLTEEVIYPPHMADELNLQDVQYWD